MSTCVPFKAERYSFVRMDHMGQAAQLAGSSFPHQGLNSGPGGGSAESSPPEHIALSVHLSMGTWVVCTFGCCGCLSPCFRFFWGHTWEW